MNSDQRVAELFVSAYICIYVSLVIVCQVLYSCHERKKNQEQKWSVQGIDLIPGHPHLNASMDSLVIAPKLLKWIEKVDLNQVEIRSMTITDVNWFAATPTPTKLGFVKFTLDASDLTTKKKIASNVVVCRGDSVAILIIVRVAKYRTKPVEYVLLCEQMRVPSGKRRREICAGMMDDNGDIASVVLKEVEEETEFKIKNKRELVPLGSVYVSPGLLDEEIHLYSWTTEISESEFIRKQEQVCGNASEGEEIKLSFVPVSQFKKELLKMKDVKAECAFHRHYTK